MPEDTPVTPEDITAFVAYVDSRYGSAVATRVGVLLTETPQRLREEPIAVLEAAYSDVHQAALQASAQLAASPIPEGSGDYCCGLHK